MHACMQSGVSDSPRAVVCGLDGTKLLEDYFFRKVSGVFLKNSTPLCTSELSSDKVTSCIPVTI